MPLSPLRIRLQHGNLFHDSMAHGEHAFDVPLDVFRHGLIFLSFYMASSLPLIDSNEWIMRLSSSPTVVEGF
jgi:hypothetical protein